MKKKNECKKSLYINNSSIDKRGVFEIYLNFLLKMPNNYNFKN